MDNNKCVLSNLQIQDEIEKGNVIIHPYRPDQMNNCSYDVTLGEYYYRIGSNDKKDHNVLIHNPYNEASVRFWFKNPKKAETLDEMKQLRSVPLNLLTSPLLKGIDPYKDKVIFLHPNETILAHTNEYIGGVNQITTMMKAKSSFGRNCIQTNKCAGWGDIGYVNRWTMEITNCNQNFIIPLVVGRPIAQIVFFYTGPCSFKYHEKGTYSESIDLTKLEHQWTPENMLPKLYLK